MERLTAAEAEEAQRRLAGALAQRGLTAGQRIGVVCHSSAATLNLVLAALRTGIIPVMVNPALLPAEQAVILGDAEPAMVVGDADLADLAGGAAPAGGAPVELAPVPLGRPMHYTSGTTGQPKGVWTGVLDEAAATRLIAEERELWGFEAGDVHLVCSPLHHSAPVRFAAGTLLAGGTVVLPGKFEPRLVAEAIATHRPTTTFMAPAHLQRLLESGVAPDVASFRLVAHAGSACPEPLKRRALATFPAGTVWEFYGSTEGQFTACGPDEWLARPGTVGRARPGRRVSTDDDGLLWCEVPPHARWSYWRDPVKTAQAWRDSAFTVGDLGRLDDDGYVFVDGRRNDLIITGGVNVYPAEVERALRELPGVHDVVVFGADDERWGQRVCAAVVGSVEPEAVVAFARTRLAAYKCPKQVVRIAEVPVSATGKVRRATLAAELGLEPG